jgi:hypothetical protein
VLYLPYNTTMPRKLVWTESQGFQGFGCSECQWIFKPTSPLVGKSLEEMKQSYEVERDKDFAAHACAKFRKAINPKKW